MAEKDLTLITDLAWGSIEVTAGGEKLHFKDCKVWPGGARDWDWRETGTEHVPGIQPTDVEEVLAKNVAVIILARGVFNRLEVQPATEALLRGRGLEYHVEETRRAVEHFNELVREGCRVGGLFHTTC